MRIVELAADGTPSVEVVPLGVGRRLCTLRGPIEQLCSDPAHAAASEARVRAILTDDTLPLQAMARLRARFPHIAELRHEPPELARAGEAERHRQVRQARSPLELATAFFSDQQGQPPGEPEAELLRAALAAAERGGAVKPHRLAIEAFGPYADPVAIDFDELAAEGLFLIHGTTGAGKTFLLDALCFALYGEVSGDRSVKGLRSDHAAPGAVPRVSLEFSCGAARYRVERTPAHTAPKARGQGTTEKPPQAVLFRLDAGAPEQAVAAKTTEVTREVEHLVGLSAAQFRQVILLPQGRFAEVLRAKAEEREALLKTLFDTVIYERAGWWLEDQARAARNLALDQAREQEVLRRRAADAWAPHAPEPPEGTEPAEPRPIRPALRR